MSDWPAGAQLASPTFTGVPAAPTATQGTNTTQLATTAYVQTEVGLLVPKSLVDAKGDLLVGTADNTVARQAVGANDTVFVAASGQTNGVIWQKLTRASMAAAGFIQTMRVDCLGFTASQQKDITVTWPVTFGDTSYTVLTDIVEETGGGTANAPAKRQVVQKSATAIVVRVTSGSTGYSTGVLFLNAVGIHD